MLFNILTLNFSYQDTTSLSPIIGHLRKTLSLCGHEVVVNRDQIIGNAINIFIEHFLEGEYYAEQIREIKRGSPNLRVGVVTTELMVSSNGERTIPYAKFGIHYGSSEDTSAILDRRMRGLDAVLPTVDFVWSLLERSASDIRAAGYRSEFLPFGCTNLADKEQNRSPKDIDVVFFGTKTPHRESVLQALRGAGINIVAVGRGFEKGHLPQVELDSILDRAKIGLNLTLHAKSGNEGEIDPRFASCVRVVEMLSRRLLVVSEDIPLDNPYSAYMESASITELPVLCESLLRKGTWKDAGLRNAESFLESMHVNKVCAPVISRTMAAIAAT